MKLHKDGTLEGTPEEINTYQRLQDREAGMKPFVPKPYVSPSILPSTTGTQPFVGTKLPNKIMFADDDL